MFYRRPQLRVEFGFCRDKKPEKKKEPSKTLKVDDNKILEGIQKAWPKVISSLKSKGKINLHTFIQIGG